MRLCRLDDASKSPFRLWDRKPRHAFASGLSNLVLGWPLVAAVSHTAGAAALVVVLTWALCESRASAALAQPAALGARELSA